MNTALLILKADGQRLNGVVDEGRAAAMFVDEDGHAKGLPRNEAATAIYRASWMARNPRDDPESLPWIAGDAAIFGRRVWS